MEGQSSQASEEMQGNSGFCRCVREILRGGQSRYKVGHLTSSVPVLNQRGPIQDCESLWEILQLTGF